MLRPWSSSSSNELSRVGCKSDSSIPLWRWQPKMFPQSKAGTCNSNLTEHRSDTSRPSELWRKSESCCPLSYKVRSQITTSRTDRSWQSFPQSDWLIAAGLSLTIQYRNPLDLHLQTGNGQLRHANGGLALNVGRISNTTTRLDSPCSSALRQAWSC